MSGWISVPEAAKLAGVHRNSFYKSYVRNGRVVTKQGKNKRTKVSVASLRQVMRDGVPKGRPVGSTDKQKRSTRLQNAKRTRLQHYENLRNSALNGLPKTTYPKNLLGEKSSMFLLWVRDRRPSVAAIQSMEVALRSYVNITGIESMGEITRQSLIQWRDEILNKRGLSVNTWNSYWSHLRAILNLAIEQYGFEGAALVVGIKAVTTHDHKNKLITDDQIERVMVFLDSTTKLRPTWFWKHVVLVLSKTGIRRRQLVGLRWSDIDTQSMKIRLRAESSKTKREWLIPLHPALLPVFDDLRTQYAQANAAVADDSQVFNVTVFYSRYFGHEMSVSHLSGAMRRIKEGLNMPCSPHRFRHAVATKLANANGGKINLKNVQQILGHTNISTTLGYVQPDMDVMSDLVAGL